MASRFLLSLLAILFSVSAQAQVYKWVDAQGNVTYSDVPPPKSAVKVEAKSLSSSDSVNNSNLPFELAQAVKNMPVTLYTSAKCPACDDGRNFLKQNGIPFSERTITSNADAEKLNSISGGSQLPFLTIGSTKLVGYGFSQWRSNLSLAGYPDSNILPPDYRFPAPQPAAPLAAAKKAPDTPQPAAQPEQPARDPNGFQF